MSGDAICAIRADMKMVDKKRWVIGWCLLVLGAGFSSTARADKPAPPAASASAKATEGAQAAETAEGATGTDAKQDESAPEPEGEKLNWEVGPKPLSLGHDVKLELPAGYRYLGQPQASDVMKKMGNLHTEDMLGLVVSEREEDQYFVTIRYEESGFIKDDEELDAEEILDTIREGEDEYNQERKQLGFPPLHADGWQEKPHYDKAKHHLIWGLTISDSEGASINYNTRILGRRGYVSVNLVTDKQHLDRDKPGAAQILGATSFTSGATYADFNASSDKVAEYGLTGLVLGGAGLGLAKAAKLGLLAKFGKFLLTALLVGKKFIVLGALALFAVLKKLLSRGEQTAA